MALKMEVEAPSGLVLSEAYIKIDQLGWVPGSMYVTFGIYANSTAREDGKETIDRRYFSFAPDVSDESPNYHVQAYEHAKMLEEYENAVDC